ncbi:hypothetical protein AC96_3227 [Escherichia coli 2-156-04_S4_C2]|nr:hypothetical protein L912_0173 [Escherichia coli SCD1]KDX24280.1 hypothetical protein AC96_3227 [Escherichia coli 2-156-04_S4_C2]
MLYRAYLGTPNNNPVSDHLLYICVCGIERVSVGSLRKQTA